MKVKASMMDVRGFIKQLEFQKENLGKLGDQAQRSAELVKFDPFGPFEALNNAWNPNVLTPNSPVRFTRSSNSGLVDSWRAPIPPCYTH